MLPAMYSVGCGAFLYTVATHNEASLTYSWPCLGFALQKNLLEIQKIYIEFILNLLYFISPKKLNVDCERKSKLFLQIHFLSDHMSWMQVTLPLIYLCKKLHSDYIRMSWDTLFWKVVDNTLCVLHTTFWYHIHCVSRELLITFQQYSYFLEDHKPENKLTMTCAIFITPLILWIVSRGFGRKPQQSSCFCKRGKNGQF